MSALPILTGKIQTTDDIIRDVIMGNPALESAMDMAGKIGSGIPAPNSGLPDYAQGERLFFARPRYAQNSADYLDPNSRAYRGPHAYIRLLTSDTQKANYQARTPGDRIEKNEDPNDTYEFQTVSDTLRTTSHEDKGAGYDKFLLTGLQASVDEKLQVVEVFGDNEVAYYFGRQPMTFHFRGLIPDSIDNGWFTDWITSYAHVFRGTQLAKNYELLEITLPNMRIIGSMTNTTWEQDANNDVNVTFAFTFLVKTLIPVPVIPVNRPITNDPEAFPWANGQLGLPTTTQAGINTLKNQVEILTGVIQDPLSSVSKIGSAMSGIGSGVGAFIGTQGTSSIFSDLIDGISSAGAAVMGPLGGILGGIGSVINGVRTSIFSPIYGVMNSLAKLVQNVFGTAGGIFSALTNPIRNILRDITGLANQAQSIARAITQGFMGFGRGTSLVGLVGDARSAINAIKNAKGAIASIPQSLAEAVRGTYVKGFLPGNTPFLKYNPKASFSSSALFTSGSLQLPIQIAILSSPNSSLATNYAAL